MSVQSNRLLAYLETDGQADKRKFETWRIETDVQTHGQSDEFKNSIEQQLVGL